MVEGAQREASRAVWRLMADDCDVAQALDERIRAGMIAAARAQIEGEGADECEDCGAPIGAARRAALPSATRCVDCQERRERRKEFR